MEGAKRAQVVGKDDKCEITAIFVIDFLPIQLVYQPPVFDFPPS